MIAIYTIVLLTIIYRTHAIKGFMIHDTIKKVKFSHYSMIFRNSLFFRYLEILYSRSLLCPYLLEI